jgi:hypothetical protein
MASNGKQCSYWISKQEADGDVVIFEYISGYRTGTSSNGVMPKWN